LIILLILGKVYKLWKFPIQPPVTRSLLRPCILLIRTMKDVVTPATL
jgi:hypothetical protein